MSSRLLDVIIVNIIIGRGVDDVNIRRYDAIA